MCENKALTELREELKPLESHFIFPLLDHVVSITGARTLRKTGLGGGLFASDLLACYFSKRAPSRITAKECASKSHFDAIPRLAAASKPFSLPSLITSLTG